VKNKKYNEIMRDLREDNDFTQTDIAKIIGTTQQHYSKYETGEYEIPLRALIILANHYDVSLDYLAGRTDCANGIGGLDKEVVKGYSVGRLITDLFSLSGNGRKYVVECIGLQKLKADAERK
jgi:transcriptional regulator with XRE-family HTH domain